ncbi:hypothetical protein D7243_22645 [Stutzerimonas stutzeri]|nr:hypothetical protein [Stutzerimonas stutzeri]
MEPEQGKYGLWYAAGVGFATREQAEAHLLKQQAGDVMPQARAGFLGYSSLHWVTSAAVAVAFIGSIAWMKFGIDDATEARVSAAEIQQCKDRIRSHVNNPATLDLHLFGGLITDMKGEGGTARVRLDFDASNSFGVKANYRALCQFAPGAPEIVIFER